MPSHMAFQENIQWNKYNRKGQSKFTCGCPCFIKLVLVGLTFCCGFVLTYALILSWLLFLMNWKHA